MNIRDYNEDEQTTLKELAKIGYAVIKEDGTIEKTEAGQEAWDKMQTKEEYQ